MVTKTPLGTRLVSRPRSSFFVPPPNNTAPRTTTTNVVSVVRSICAYETHARDAHARDARDTHALKASSREDSLYEQSLELTPVERKKLLDRLLLDTQHQGGTTEARDISMWSTAVHRAYTRAIGDADGGLVGEALVRKQVAAGVAWKPVLLFMQSSRMLELTVTERQRAYFTLAELLLDYARAAARNAGVPLSLRLVCNCMTNIAGVFEVAFPGYLEAGLARAVVRKQ